MLRAALLDIANVETLSDDDKNNWAIRRGREAI